MVGELAEERGVRKHGVRYGHWSGGVCWKLVWSAVCSLTLFNLSVDKL